MLNLGAMSVEENWVIGPVRVHILLIILSCSIVLLSFNCKNKLSSQPINSLLKLRANVLAVKVMFFSIESIQVVFGSIIRRIVYTPVCGNAKEGFSAVEVPKRLSC